MVRKRSGVPSGELNDTRRLGSADARWYTSQGEKAVFRRRSIAARNAVKTPGETARGAGARPRCNAARRTRPEVPCAATVRVVAGRTEAGGGELRRTRPRRRICIRRVGRRTRKSPALHREYRYPNRGRTLEGKPAQSITSHPTSNAEQSARHCHEGRDLIDYAKSRSGGMADAADLKSAAW